MSKILFYIGLISFMINFNICHAQNEVPLSNWKFKIYGDKKSHDAIVPGNLLTDLFHHRLIPHPYLCSKDTIDYFVNNNWVYFSSFDLNDEQIKTDDLFLVFNGIDCYANIFLNDSLLGYVSNSFLKYEYSIVNFVKKHNILRVEFLNKDSIERKQSNNLTYKLPEGNRVFSRSPQFNYGWDFAPPLIGLGIVDSVKLLFIDNQHVSNLLVQTNEITSNSAKLSANLELFSTNYDSVQIKLLVDDRLVIIDKKFVLQKGVNILPFNYTLLHPILWGPNGSGVQKLYQVKCFLDNKLYCSRKFGIRKIENRQINDSLGKSFEFYVNNKKVFCKGSNMVPPEVFYADLSPQKCKALIDKAYESNFNMIRIWGGGYYMPDYFYDYCDEKGIMIWHDFMFACAMYPGDSNFIHNVKQEAIYQVKRLANHPCIALWCGNNEIDEGWNNWGWQKQYGYSSADSSKIYSDYKKLFQDILPAVVNKYTPSTFYLSSSPLNGWGRAISLSEGDSHYWGIWWGFEPFANYANKIPRFASEFGFQGYPSTKLFANWTSSPDSNDNVFRKFQRHPRGFETIQTYMNRDYPVPNNHADFAYLSQLMQAEEIGRAAALHRSAFKKCSGTLYWQFNDCWPSVSWSSIDHDLTPKLLLDEIKNVYAPVFLFADTSNGVRNAILTNHLNTKVSGVLKVFKFYSDSKESPIQIDQQIVTVNANDGVVMPLNKICIDATPNVVYQLLFESSTAVSKTFLYNCKPNRLKLVDTPFQFKRTDDGIVIWNEHFVYGFMCDDPNYQKLLNGQHYLLPKQEIKLKMDQIHLLDKYFTLNKIVKDDEQK